MSKVPVNQIENLEWKYQDGTTKSISELSDQELVQFRKLTVKKLQNYYSKFEMFNALFESLDNEINCRVIVKEESLV